MPNFGIFTKTISVFVGTGKYCFFRQNSKNAAAFRNNLGPFFVQFDRGRRGRVLIGAAKGPLSVRQRPFAQ